MRPLPCIADTLVLAIAASILASLPNPTISRRGFLFGGTPAGNAQAAADWWSRALVFYEEAMGDLKFEDSPR